MNEAGLTVHELWLNSSRYPSPDSRASVSIDQFLHHEDTLPRHRRIGALRGA